MINLSITAADIVLVSFFLNQAPLPGGIVHKLSQIDWTGSLLFTAGSTLMLFGITAGGVMYDWNSVGTILPIVLGATVLVVFAFWEGRYAKNPMIVPGTFRNWTLIAGYLQAVLHGMLLWALLYFLTLYCQGVKRFDAIHAGVAVLPETLTVAPAAGIVGAVAGMTGKYRWSLWTGWVLTTFGTGILYLLDADTPTGQWVGLNISVGLGTGMLFPAVTLTVQAASEPALNAQAAAFFSFMRVFGQSIGVATSGVNFQNAFQSKLLALGVPQFVAVADSYSREATAIMAMIRNMPAGADRDALINAYNQALRIIWLSPVGFVAAGLLVSLTVTGYSLNQAHVTEHRFIDGDKKKQAQLRSVGDVESGEAVIGGETRQAK